MEIRSRSFSLLFFYGWLDWACYTLLLTRDGCRMSSFTVLGHFSYR